MTGEWKRACDLLKICWTTIHAMDDDDQKTRAASSRTGLLIAMSNVETRFEQLQKKVVALEDFSGAGVTLLRNELKGVQKQIERALAAADAMGKKPGPPERF